MAESLFVIYAYFPFFDLVMDDTVDLKKGALVSLWGMTAYCMILMVQILQNIRTLYSPIIPRYVLWEANRPFLYDLVLLLAVALLSWVAYRKGCYVASIVLVSIPITICLLLSSVGVHF